MNDKKKFKETKEKERRKKTKRVKGYNFHYNIFVAELDK